MRQRKLCACFRTCGLYRGMEKVCVYIDAGNFYHLVLKKLELSEKDFDFNKFVSFLSGEKRTVQEMGKRYYVGTVREKRKSNI